MVILCPKGRGSCSLYVHNLLFVLNLLERENLAHGSDEYDFFSNRPIRTIDGTLTSTTNQGQSRPESNGKTEVFTIRQNSRIEALPLYTVSTF